MSKNTIGLFSKYYRATKERFSKLFLNAAPQEVSPEALPFACPSL